VKIGTCWMCHTQGGLSPSGAHYLCLAEARRGLPLTCSGEADRLRRLGIHPRYAGRLVGAR
jgi:hypothetical protein